MKYEKAIGCYFKRNKQARKSFDRILYWDSNKTLTQNAERFQISASLARTFSLIYRLKYYKKNSLQNNEIKNFAKALDKLRRLGYTYEQIGRLHKMTRQRVFQILRDFKKGKGK